MLRGGANITKMEGCESGLIAHLGKVMDRNVTGVRISHLPPEFGTVNTLNSQTI